MALEILEELRTLGVNVTIIGPDRIRVQPASVIPPALMERVRAAKPEIILALTAAVQNCAHCGGTGECACPACTLRRTTNATPCSVCRWADHRKWLADHPETKCWHCLGEKTCRCIVCWNIPSDAAGECVICRGSGIAAGWVQ